MSPFEKLTRPWEVFLVHHTHVDIGYTDPQPAVFRQHAEYIAQALDYCAATDALPPGERFCWTCEVSWTAKRFLARCPERREELFRRVREGRIEVTGLYLQLTDLFTEELLDDALTYACALAREGDFQVVTAMNDDVNGWAWGLPRLMAARGIRYFDTAINETRSLGVRPRPRPFYWASPDGSRVLMWHGEHYMAGNPLAGEDREERLADYLANLEASGYPHHAVELRVQGELRDNAPPGLWLSEVVRAWNTSHDHPRLRLCTPRAWFEHLEAAWPEPIPELRAGWPDWWADGNGTALYESALVRAAQADLRTAEALAGSGAEVDSERLESAREAAMLFCEHTWGAWCSTDDPDSLQSRAQWAHKAACAYTASTEAATAVRDAVLSCVKGPGHEPAVAVFNPLPFRRTDLVEVEIPDEALGAAGPWVSGPARLDEGPALRLLDAENGEAIPAASAPAIAGSPRRPAQTVRFLARDVPALGWRCYRVIVEALALAPRTRCCEATLENAFFRVIVNPRTGGLATALHLPSGRELVAAGDYTLNQHVYEIIASPEGRERLCTWSGVRHDTPFQRSTPTVGIVPGPAIPFGASLVVEGGGGDVPFIRSEIILYDELERIELVNTLTKLPLDRAEAVYHAFPLAAREPTVYLDVPGAAMRPGLDQVPGTATDWHGIQHYFAVSDADATAVVASPDVPLVQVNGINTGKWQPEAPPPTGLVMSWVMNNYWFTNFPARQGGTVRYRYAIGAFPGPFDREVADRFARGIRQPLVGVVLPQGSRPRGAAE